MSQRYMVIDDISRGHKHHKAHKNLNDDDKHAKRKLNNKKTPLIDSMANEPNDHVYELNNVAEYDKLRQSKDKVIVFYGAKWCHACSDVQDLYYRLANRYHDRITFAHVDIDVAQLDFSNVPVFVSIKNGKEVDSFESSDRDGLRNLVKNAILSK